jgi:hypothetical protein
MLMKKPVLFLFFLMLFVAGKAAVDSSRLRISLLTCSPGTDLYSIFGHSALRIVDSAAGTDIVYNFGTFNFDDPDFYTKFVRGRLRYFLSQENFSDFRYAYHYFKRGITEQVLALSSQEKKQIQANLFENLREENRSYAYDFLFDNCTTRLRDIIFNPRSGQDFDLPPLYEGEKTFRSHLHGYLKRAEMQWTQLGVDLLLGTAADKKMSTFESMFLPDHLAQGVQLANRNGQTILQEEVEILPDAQPKPFALSFWQTPLFFFSLIALLVLLPIFSTSRWQRAYILTLDRVLFISTGVLGVLLVFMWVGTDHTNFRNNINLVWAVPLNLIVGFMLPVHASWKGLYARVYAVLLVLFFVVILLMPGLINPSFMPLIAVLFYRSWMMGKNNKKA